jgi:O-antigen/teichoic acid export membrane protein
VSQDPALPADPPPRAAAVAASTAGSLALSVLVKARGLAVVPLYAWLLEPAEIGIVNLAAATATLLAPALHLGLPTGLLVELPHLRDRAREARGLRTALWLVAGLTALALVLVPPALRASKTPSLAAIAPHALVVAVFAAALAAREIAQVVPQLRRQGVYLSLLAVAIEYVGAALGLGLVALGYGPGGLLWGIAAVVLGGALVALARTRALVGPADGWDGGLVRGGLAIGLPMLAITTAYTVVQTIDRFFLAHHHGTAAVGVYSIAYTVASGVLALAATVNLVFLPVAVALLEGPPAKLLAFVAESLRLLVLAVGLCVAGAYVVGAPVLRALAGPGFDAGGALLPPLALGYALFTVGQLFQWVPLSVTRRVGGVAASHLFAAALNVALAAVLVPPYGMRGAVAAAVAAYAAGAALLALVARRALPALRFAPAGRATAVAVLASLAGAALALPPDAPLPLAAGAAVAATLLYVSLAVGTGSLHRGDLELLRRVVSGRASAN